MRFFIVTAALMALANAFVAHQYGSHIQSRSACSGNTASDRSSWCDYDINTDYYLEVPDTGVVREYWLEIRDVIIAPDGVERKAQTFNGSIPGPTLIADWGDTVIVHVTNSLETSINGSSVHFHGIRQNHTNYQDGVVSITQCPTAPGSIVTYKWRATQYGSSWYHSHFGLQTYEGVFGGIIINGPASAAYDEDAGNIILNDWLHRTPDEVFPSVQREGLPNMENSLINGTNVFGADGDENQVGERFSLKFEKGRKYRLRFANGAIDSLFRVSIDNHTLTVISTDFVPVEPYETDSITLSIGQRMDVIVTANQADVASSFWLRADPQEACTKTQNPRNVMGIVRYGDDSSLPTTKGLNFTDSCQEEATAHLIPKVPKDVQVNSKKVIENVTLHEDEHNIFKWYLNTTSMVVEWDNPSVLKVQNKESFGDSNAMVRVPEKDSWVYVAIETAHPIPHPIHLHGFDFHIIAQGDGPYDPSSPLQLKNPPRRDTAILPGEGHLVLAFYTDNPGVWLMHCHIGWHAAGGFSLQFLVRQDEIADLVTDEETEALEEGCAEWKAYAEELHIEQEDAGV